MIFMPEEGSICLHDDDNILVFPLLVEEIKMLEEDKIYFQNYINLNFLADYNKELLNNQIQDFKKENPILSLWVVTSAIDRAIIGLIYTQEKQSDSVEITLSFSKEFENFDYQTTAIKLLCDYALKNKIKSISSRISKDDKFNISALENNNFTKIEENNEKIAFFKEF